MTLTELYEMDFSWEQRPLEQAARLLYDAFNSKEPRPGRFESTLFFLKNAGPEYVTSHPRIKQDAVSSPGHVDEQLNLAYFEGYEAASQIMHEGSPMVSRIGGLGAGGVSFHVPHRRYSLDTYLDMIEDIVGNDIIVREGKSYVPVLDFCSRAPFITAHLLGFADAVEHSYDKDSPTRIYSERARQMSGIDVIIDHFNQKYKARAQNP